MTLPAPASGTSGHTLLRKEVLEKRRVASAEEELPYFDGFQTVRLQYTALRRRKQT
jgi:hypothetical protein